MTRHIIKQATVIGAFRLDHTNKQQQVYQQRQKMVQQHWYHMLLHGTGPQ
jgi:hypothetical protein